MVGGRGARPEIRAATWKLCALGDDLALTRLLPLDGLSAGLQAERDGRWSVGPKVAIPLPVFDMGQARSERVTAAQVEARHELVHARRRVIEEVRLVLESLNGNRNNLHRMRNELIPLPKQRRALAEAAFKTGQSKATAIYLAEQYLRATEAKSVELEPQASTAAIRLQRAVGERGPAEASSRPDDLTRPATQPSNESK
jgi:outer membrane protein, heavy metal efflux system